MERQDREGKEIKMELQYHNAPQGERTYIEREHTRRETQGEGARNLDAQMKEEVRNRYTIHQGAG